MENHMRFRVNPQTARAMFNSYVTNYQSWLVVSTPLMFPSQKQIIGNYEENYDLLKMSVGIIILNIWKNDKNLPVTTNQILMIRLACLTQRL